MHLLIPCLAVAAVTLSVIIKTLAPQGINVQVCTCLYIISLTTTQLLITQLTAKPFLFKFPGFVTTAHFLSCWIVSVAYWMASGDVGKCRPRSLGTSRRYVSSIVPITLTMPVAVICNNIALMHIAAGLNSIISAISPIVTAMVSMLLGRKVSGLGWFGLLVALVGAIIISLGEVKAGIVTNKGMIIGVVFALCAVVFRSLKTVLQDRLLNSMLYRGGEEQPLHKEQAITPMHMWALQAPPMVFTSLLYSLCTESLTKAVHQLTWPTAGLVFATCVSASMLNILGAVTIKTLGASLMQAIGKLNVIFTVAFSVAFMGERLPIRVLIGAGVVLVGIVIFDKAESRAVLNADSKQKASSV